jgi:hypothetical protein
MSEPRTIDAYLDALAERLVVPPQRLRRVLAETEDHLRAAMSELMNEGVEPAEAESRAIQRFGSVDVVAKGFAGGPVAWAPLFGAALRPLYGVAVVGLLAIGLSGLLSLGLASVFGKDFVAGDASGVTYTPERCARYFALEPHATDCNDAAVRHHFGEIVDTRIAAGVLGLMALGGLWFVSRRNPRSRMPDWFAPMVGASIFGIAAVGLVGLSGGSSGQAGASLSGAAVAAAVAVVYGLRLTRYLGADIQSD